MLRIIVQALKVLTVAAMAILVAAGGFRAFQLAVDEARPDDTGQPVKITIGRDESDEQVADKLEQSGLIRSKLLFQGQMRLTGGAIAPGTYTIRRGMSVPQIVDLISGAAPAVADTSNGGGDTASTGAPATFQITIPEGWRIGQIADEYAKMGGQGGADAFLKAVQEVDRSQYDFLADLPADASLEGYLFPDTYTFRADDPAADVQMMLDNFGEQVTPDMRARAGQMNLSLNQVITFASLVEREAQDPQERPTIADVYLSRYEQGWKLEADPTVQYALGKAGDWWPQVSGSDLEQSDSPYNTYKIDGLPPGPICNPGIASIKAVLEPADTPYMFFVAKNDGSGDHAFAVTSEEQQANIEQYQGGSGNGG